MVRRSRLVQITDAEIKYKINWLLDHPEERDEYPTEYDAALDKLLDKYLRRKTYKGV